LARGGEILKINLATGNGTHLAIANVRDELVATSDSLYWFQYTAGGTLQRVAQDGGSVEILPFEPAPLDSIVDGLGGLAADSAHLYFMTHYGSIDGAITIYRGSPSGPVIPIYRHPGPTNESPRLTLRLDDEYAYFYEPDRGFLRIPK
jgi:hypothetical protein